MGKKRKVKEISEEDRIQTVLVRDGYGYHQPDTWDVQDKKRNDNGLYVAIEWLEFIFGGQAGPGSLQTQRIRGSAVEAIWQWNGRTDLLVAVRRDIDLAPLLGKHYFSDFLRNPPKGTEDGRASLITRARYESDDQIMGMGEGWKLASPVPFVEVSSIRKHKFTEPYPSPGGSTSLLRNPNSVKTEDSKNVKPQIKHESSVVGVKREAKAEDSMTTGSAIAIGSDADVKPTLVQSRELSTTLKPDPGQPDVVPDILSAPETRGYASHRPPKGEPADINVKEESFDDMIRRAQARREEDRRAALVTASSGDNLAIVQTSQQQASVLGLAVLDEDIKPRPTKRVKKEELQ